MLGFMAWPSKKSLSKGLMKCVGIRLVLLGHIGSHNVVACVVMATFSAPFVKCV